MKNRSGKSSSTLTTTPYSDYVVDRQVVYVVDGQLPKLIYSIAHKHNGSFLLLLYHNFQILFDNHICKYNNKEIINWILVKFLRYLIKGVYLLSTKGVLLLENPRLKATKSRTEKHPPGYRKIRIFMKSTQFVPVVTFSVTGNFQYKDTSSPRFLFGESFYLNLRRHQLNKHTKWLAPVLLPTRSHPEEIRK